MGATGRTFLHIRMEEEHYNELNKDIRDFMEIRRVEIEGEEYPQDPTWKELKRLSKKAYKDLKNYEYDKRHKPINK